MAESYESAHISQQKYHGGPLEVLESADGDAYEAQCSAAHNGVVKITHVSDFMVWEPEKIGDILSREPDFTF